MSNATAGCDNRPSTSLRKPWQRYAAEFLGTFALVFVGCGAAITHAANGQTVTHVGVSLAFGFVVLAMIYALGPVCAAHFNPAVTLAFASAKKFPWRRDPWYIASQISGGIFASFLHSLIYGNSALTARFGATIRTITPAAAFGLEVVLTFILMLVIIAVATDRRASTASAGLSIGLTVASCALMGGPLSGASMNPARSLAPAVWAGGDAISALPIYLLAPCSGAIMAALLFEQLRDDPMHAQAAPADFD